MAEITTLNIGLVGLGTIGSGVIKILAEQREVLLKKTGLDVQLRTVCDLDLAGKQYLIGNSNAVTDFREVVEDPEIDLVIELIGGYNAARELTLESLRQGKTVVTANKALLALYGKEIFAAARESGQEIGFEAAVAGTIPVIRSIQSGLVANNIESIYGILNGTTNYVLTKMAQENWSYEEALGEAQRLGFAEADPTFDVEGTDACHKICLLSWLGFGARIPFDEIPHEGITHLARVDIQTAQKLGYEVKLLGIAKTTEEGIDCRVHPTMIPVDHILSSVQNEVNAVLVDSNYSGETTYIGKGAGSEPTAAAVLSDVLYYGARRYLAEKRLELPSVDEGQLMPRENSQSRFYIRLTTEDRSGILARVFEELGREDISVAQVVQEEEHEKDRVPIIIITHTTNVGKVERAVKKIQEEPFITGETVIIRVEE